MSDGIKDIPPHEYLIRRYPKVKELNSMFGVLIWHGYRLAVSIMQEREREEQYDLEDFDQARQIIARDSKEFREDNLRKFKEQLAPNMFEDYISETSETEQVTNGTEVQVSDVEEPGQDEKEIFKIRDLSKEEKIRFVKDNWDPDKYSTKAEYYRSFDLSESYVWKLHNHYESPKEQEEKAQDDELVSEEIETNGSKLRYCEKCDSDIDARGFWKHEKHCNTDQEQESEKEDEYTPQDIALDILDFLSENKQVHSSELFSAIEYCNAKELRYALRRLQEFGIVITVPDLADMRTVNLAIAEVLDIPAALDRATRNWSDFLEEYFSDALITVEAK